MKLGLEARQGYLVSAQSTLIEVPKDRRNVYLSNVKRHTKVGSVPHRNWFLAFYHPLLHPPKTARSHIQGNLEEKSKCSSHAWPGTWRAICCLHVFIGVLCGGNLYDHGASM